MLRTNTKKACENIRKYIVSHYDPCGYDDLPESEDFAVVASAILKTWRDEYKYGIERCGNYQDAFASWTQGLPSVLDCCYWYNRSAVDDLGEIPEESETEKSKYDEEQAGTMLSRLIYRELLKGERKQTSARPLLLWHGRRKSDGKETSWRSWTKVQ